jgi:hypothetical protein
MGKERRKEYQDALVVRTFAAFLNALKDQSFKKRMEKDRRAEDLVLIFYSNATKELSKGKEPDDDSWRLMVASTCIELGKGATGRALRKLRI